MIRRLSEGLDLPADVLVQRYALRDAAYLSPCHNRSVLCSVYPVLCLVVPVFDEFALIGFLSIQSFTEHDGPSFRL
jgi:hypothetical protein